MQSSVSAMGSARSFEQTLGPFRRRAAQTYTAPEYVQLPPGLMCYVIGKSSWGRMGLIIATATKVDPGFKGCITLEIVNEGEIPLVLYPGYASRASRKNAGVE